MNENNPTKILFYMKDINHSHSDKFILFGIQKIEEKLCFLTSKIFTCMDTHLIKEHNILLETIFIYNLVVGKIKSKHLLVILVEKLTIYIMMLKRENEMNMNKNSRKLKKRKKKR